MIRGHAKRVLLVFHVMLVILFDVVVSERFHARINAGPHISCVNYSEREVQGITTSLGRVGDSIGDIPSCQSLDQGRTSSKFIDPSLT